MPPSAAIPDFDALIAGRAPERRGPLALLVAGLFLAHAPRLNAEQVRLFDDVLARLAVEADSRSLIALTRQVAPTVYPLPLLMQILAREEICLAEIAEAGRAADVIAAVARACCIPEPRVRALLRSERLDAVIVLCKAADWSWGTVRAILGLRADTAAPTSGDLDVAFANFESLSRATALRVLRFWRRR